MLCLKKPYFKCYKTVKKLTVLLRDIGTLLLVGCSSTLFKIRKCLYLFADFLEHYTGGLSPRSFRVCWKNPRNCLQKSGKTS